VSANLKASSEQQLLTYRWLLPSPGLTTYVRGYEYTELQGADGPPYPFAVSVFPAVSFFLRGRPKVFEYATQRTRVLPRSIAVGPCDHRVADLLHAGRLASFTIAFRPTGFFRLFGISPWEIRNHAFDLGDVLGEPLTALHEPLAAAMRPEQMAATVDQALIAFAERALPRSGVEWAAEALLRSRGRADLLAMSCALGLSDSSWRRHFTTEIGATPKRYLRIVRFRHALALKRGHGLRPWTEVCLEAGYYDQAHFIAECQALVGCTPSRFLRELAVVPQPWVTAVYGAPAGAVSGRFGRSAGWSAVFGERAAGVRCRSTQGSRFSDQSYGMNFSARPVSTGSSR
jgi:AraC-like DNA-binding protein